MAALTKSDAHSSLPDMVREAASRLAAAQTSAEVLDARLQATVAYDVAKSAGRIARAKKAHDEVIVAVYRAQADALEIESAAKRRLADEYDAAQERGEIRGNGERSFSGAGKASADEAGLSPKDIHEARQLRDAERADPGVTRRSIDRIVERGEEPTRAAVRREIVSAPPRKPQVSDDALWLWGRLCDFERHGYLKAPAGDLLDDMTPAMRGDVLRLAPLVAEYLQTFEAA
jgi:hypothetical protein